MLCKSWSIEDIEFLKSNYKHIDYKSIAKTLNRTEKAIKRKCNVLKLIKQVRYKYTDDYFETWSSNMAYILGFLTADGCLQNQYGRKSLEFCIHKKDIEILKFVQSEICPNRPIKKYGNMIYLKFDSIPIVKSLMNLGIVSRKTGKECLPDNLPIEYLSDYTRGLFDGDGCVSIRYKQPKFYICSSSENFLKSIQEKWNIGYIKYSGIYYWNVHRKNDIKLLNTAFYKNNSFALQRKKEKMLSVK